MENEDLGSSEVFIFQIKGIEQMVNKKGRSPGKPGAAPQRNNRQTDITLTIAFRPLWSR